MIIFRAVDNNTVINHIKSELKKYQQLSKAGADNWVQHFQ